VIIETPRLKLIRATLESLWAELKGPAELSEVLKVEVPDNWPPDLYDVDAINWAIRYLEKHPNTPWAMYYFVRSPAGTHENHVAVGCGGYKGEPSNGTVEVGYSVLEQFRRNGYAREAVEGFLWYAFEQDDIDRVIAETMPDLEPSVGVLEKCGFDFIGEGSEPGVIRYELKRQ
jgi:[ribosomal protein S5]-alanine N-acetyltransferase